jgi:hypothetical protein
VDPQAGILPMPADAGIGCFVDQHYGTFLTAVHSENPATRRDGEPNDGREAYGIGVGDIAVLSWIEGTLLSARETPVDAIGGSGACSDGRGRIDIFARGAATGIKHWKRIGTTWSEATPPPAPSPEAPDPLGVLCAPDGGFELFSRDGDGILWMHGLADGRWRSNWQIVLDAVTPVASGIAVVGDGPDHFYLFARDTGNRLRRAEYSGGWTGDWLDLGGDIRGTPSARSTPEGRIDVFVQGRSQDIWQHTFLGGIPQGWVKYGDGTASDPVVLGSAYEELELFFLTEQSQITHATFQEIWAPSWLRTQVPMPAGHWAGVAEVPGNVDLFVTPTAGGPIWNAHWPRSPRRQSP